MELSVAQLRASRDAMLAGWDGRAPLWVFGYASLIWKPELEFDARCPARAHGYHRRLCLRSVAYRGTPEAPGLVAGLDRGGSCAGVAFRLPAASVPAQFERLWQREMFLGAYVPRWLKLSAADGTRFAALAFVIDRAGPLYCAGLPEAELARVLCSARGARGTSLEYLEMTVAALRAEGLRDRHLERLARLARDSAPAD